MSESGINNSLKRLRNRYRLIVINEDTYEEVVGFKLSRVSVYTLFSVLFILMICVTAAIIIFTPLKYYLPGVGMGDAKQIKEYRELKLKADSLEKAMILQDNYYKNVANVLGGNIKPKDTTTIQVKKPDEKKTTSKKRRR